MNEQGIKCQSFGKNKNFVDMNFSFCHIVESNVMYCHGHMCVCACD